MAVEVSPGTREHTEVEDFCRKFLQEIHTECWGWAGDAGPTQMCQDPKVQMLGPSCCQLCVLQLPRPGEGRQGWAGLNPQLRCIFQCLLVLEAAVLWQPQCPELPPSPAHGYGGTAARQSEWVRRNDGFMLGLLAPSCALPCPQGTANAVLKPQAESSLFISHRGIRAHRQDWEHWGSQPPPNWAMLDSHCCFLSVSAMLSPPLPQHWGRHSPSPQLWGSCSVPEAVQGCSPRQGMSSWPGATAALPSRCLEEPRGLWSLLDTEEHVCLCFDTFVHFPPEVCGLVLPPSFCELKELEKMF